MTPKSKLKSTTTPTSEAKKPSSSNAVTPETPKTQVKSTPGKDERNVKDADVIPSSLERKSSGYRSFMMREGPQALGSKEIPRVKLAVKELRPSRKNSLELIELSSINKVSLV